MTDEYFNSKEFKHILAEYEESEKTGQPVFLDADDFTDIAEYYHNMGDMQKATEVINLAASMHPGAAAPLIFKARVALLKQDNPRLADEIAEQISDKTDLDYYYIKAEIMIAEDRIEEANAYLEEKYECIDDVEQEDYILDVVTLFIDYELLDEANEWIQHPYSTLYWNYLASLQLMSNHIEDSITSSEYSIAINPNDDEALLNKANALFSLGNFEEALDYYQRFTKLRPDEDAGEMYQGIALLSMNRLEEAVEHLKKAEQLSGDTSPNHVEICQELAFTLSRLHRMDEALMYVNLTDTLVCDHDEMMVLRGHVLLENGQYEEAQRCFSEAVKSSSASPHIYLRIAISVYDNGYNKLAYKMFAILLNSVDDKWYEGYSYMALCCKDLGKRNEYLKYLKKACLLNPWEARTVLGEYFPPEMPPEEYYNYETK